MLLLRANRVQIRRNAPSEDIGRRVPVVILVRLVHEVFIEDLVDVSPELVGHEIRFVEACRSYIDLS